MQPLSSKKHMLRKQHKMHQSIVLFPSQSFYEDKISNGPKINDSSYSGDLNLNLAHYSFHNIRAVDKHRHKGKITVQAAAILKLIEKLYKGR
jgi:senataxin